MTTKIKGTTGVDRVEADAYTGRAGELFDFAGTVAPSYAIARPKVPTNVLRSLYPDLYAAIGTTWGAGDGSTTFGLPYIAADEVDLCADANVATASVGDLRAHTHGFTYNSVAGAGSGVVNSNGASGSFTPTQTVSPAGGAKNLAAGMRVLKCVRIR